MEKRPIDKSKQSNIKCENCMHWKKCEGNTDQYMRPCSNKESKKYGILTNYWNRCRGFEWRE